MTYKLRYVNMTDEQIRKIEQMHIPETGDGVDDVRFLEKSLKNIDASIDAFEDAISEILGEDQVVDERWANNACRIAESELKAAEDVIDQIIRDEKKDE